MGAVDLLNPLKRHQPIVWGRRNLAASIAGLGDLMIHLPLLSAMAIQAGERRISLDIALRPNHVELGQRLGWSVLSLENPLQAFFNNKAPLRHHYLTWTTGAQALRNNDYELCLDLSGSAFNVLLFKTGGVRRVASRTTRGGASLVAHVLDHRPYENEYLYRTRLAEMLGITPDFSVYERLFPSSIRRGNEIIVALTTACRWRNWRLRNFGEVIRAFPKETFVLVGNQSEIIQEERQSLAQIEALPRVQNLIGKLSTLQFINRVSVAKAIITNDSSAAHIANAYHRPGLVLFGPEESSTWAMPGGLEVLHDKKCPHFPCIQWHCSNQANWCMDKIKSADVILRLKHLLFALE